MATFTGSPVVPAGLSPEELLAPMAAFDTHQNALLKQQADTIANAYAPQKNQLFLDTGAIANQFATAKNPLEIQSLRQQLGLDPNPNRDQIMRLFSGDGTGQTSTAGGGGGGDSTTETADDLTRAAAVRDGLIQRGMQPDGATAFAANALHESKANPFTGAGDAGASHGIFQWNGDRLAAFRAANGGLLPEQTSLDKQLDFVVSELRGPESTALGRIMGAQGVADKAGQVSEAYLRPKDTVPEMQRRSATALRLARAWGGQGAPGVTPPVPGAPAGATPPPAATAAGPAIGAPGGPNITPGMTDQAWLEEMAKRYPTLAGPNDTSQQPTPAAPPAPYQVASNAPVAPPLPPNQLAPGGDRGLRRRHPRRHQRPQRRQRPRQHPRRLRPAACRAWRTCRPAWPARRFDRRSSCYSGRRKSSCWPVRRLRIWPPSRRRRRRRTISGSARKRCYRRTAWCRPRRGNSTR